MSRKSFELLNDGTLWGGFVLVGLILIGFIGTAVGF